MTNSKSPSRIRKSREYYIKNKKMVDLRNKINYHKRILKELNKEWKKTKQTRG